jgi:hypothetical protein
MRIHPDYSDVIQFIFENGDKMPEGFYIQIMDLIKKIYLNEHGENLEKIHELLEQNKKVIDKNILNVLKRSFKKKNNFNYISFRYHCLQLCFFSSLTMIIILGAGVGIVWTIIRR